MIADRSAFPSSDGADKLAHFMAESERVGEYSDIELSNAVLQEVWGEIEDQRAEILLAEILGRFDAMCGIERDDEGKVVS